MKRYNINFSNFLLNCDNDEIGPYFVTWFGSVFLNIDITSAIFKAVKTLLCSMQELDRSLCVANNYDVCKNKFSQIYQTKWI